ncbi:MAG: hypothetical protein ACJAVK_001458 [Akkermansiaceae bacterium]|jgi:hypothetical protein
MPLIISKSRPTLKKGSAGFDGLGETLFALFFVNDIRAGNLDIRDHHNWAGSTTTCEPGNDHSESEGLYRFFHKSLLKSLF